MKRNIALVAACPFPSPQGSQVFVGQMAERLAAAGHRVHLLTYGQGDDTTGRGYSHHRTPRVPGDDSRRSGPNLAKPLLDGLLAARLIGVVRRHGIDVIHAHNYEAAVAGLVARAVTGVPVVYHSHNLMGDELETYFHGGIPRRLASALGRLLDRTIPRSADRTIALCEWSAAQLVKCGTPARSISVIPPAVHDDGGDQASAVDRAAFGLAEDDFVVGYCGNLDAYQNLPLLLEAMRLFASGMPGRQSAREPAQQPVRLLIATHSVPRSFAAIAEASALGDVLKIHVIRSHDETRRAMAASDILTLPRRLGSGYPVKLLNYMSAARATVSAGCGSKILRSGVDGIVVADDDAAAMARAFDRCRRDPGERRALGDAARRTFLERLTWDSVLPQIEAVYEGLREPVGPR
ncbi:MAG TPA: glycosyltransferase family 4 protein [Candidatus Limnocylindrales bacterium]|nr:glycosyltransferase family 4 protein [Candidatus Limnocylindrales bacterium]